MVIRYLGCWYRPTLHHLDGPYRERLEADLDVHQPPENSVAVGVDGSAGWYDTAGVAHSGDCRNTSSGVRYGDEHGPVTGEGAQQSPVLSRIGAGTDELEIKTDQPWGVFVQDVEQARIIGARDRKLGVDSLQGRIVHGDDDDIRGGRTDTFQRKALVDRGVLH